MADRNETGDEKVVPNPSESAPDSADLARTEVRDQLGRFVPGQKGGGRKRGSKNRLPRDIRRLVAENADAIARAMIVKAKSGNSHAGTALLRLVCAPAKETSEPITLDLQRITSAADAADAISDVILATTTGKLSPDGARDLVSMISALLKSFESVDLERRLGAIESALKIGTAS